MMRQREITKHETIEISHILDLDYDSRCENLHGHSYRFELRVVGDTDQNGMVVDYSDISAAFDLVLDEWDHTFLCPERFVATQDEQMVSIDYPRRSFMLPPEDVTLLNVDQSTAENLAMEFLWETVKHIPDAKEYKFAATVNETASTSVRFPWRGWIGGEELWDWDAEDLRG